MQLEKKLQKTYPTDCNLFQAHYQILSVIFLKEFVKLNVNTETMIKNVKLAELNINIESVFLNAQY